MPYRTDQILHADITYIRIVTSFAYLVGYGLGRTLSKDLARAALLDAISKRNTEDLIHHTDQGIQYCSLDYVEVLKEHGIAISMSGKANTYGQCQDRVFLQNA